MWIHCMAKVALKKSLLREERPSFWERTGLQSAGASSDSVNSKGVSDSLPSLSFFFFSFPLSNHAYFFSFLPFLFPNLLAHLCKWSKYFLMLSFKAGFHWFCGKTANFSPTSIFSFLPMFYLSTWLFCKRLHLPTSPTAKFGWALSSGTWVEVYVQFQVTPWEVCSFSPALLLHPTAWHVDIVGFSKTYTWGRHSNGDRATSYKEPTSLCERDRLFSILFEPLLPWSLPQQLNMYPS